MSLKRFTLRDPIHGFLEFNQLEWDIINSDAFQRLRRVRQLAWTDLVYPSAMHTRFAHSLGVCEVASRLFDAIRQRDADILQSEYGFEASGLDRQRQIIRIAALMHDLGHGPFSHAAEETFPKKPNSEKLYVHEEYSSAIARHYLGDVLKSSNFNKRNFNISIDDVVSFFDPLSTNQDSILWKEIISGQMDADRMDYLLRDSYHSGVSYGRYDLDRVVDTIALCEDSEVGGHHIGIDDAGIHAVEGLLIARYMMFTQVYFHKTRVIYDFHFSEALKAMLSDGGGVFPPPTEDAIGDYFSWDDWKVSAKLHAGEAGEHGERLMGRNHYRLCFATSEVPSAEELQRFEHAVDAMSDLPHRALEASKSWYKVGGAEIRVNVNQGQKKVPVPLATKSPIVNGLKTVNQQRAYVPVELRSEAAQRASKFGF